MSVRRSLFAATAPTNLVDGELEMATKKASAKKSPKPLVEAQPQSNQAAAQSAGVFLKTDDSWSNAYWTAADLHFKERELFG
jgi:hypothetical protein